MCILYHCCVCLCVWGAGWTSPARYAEVLFPGSPLLCLPAFLLEVGSACPLWWLFYWTRALRRPWGCVANPEKENGGRPAPWGQGGRSHKRAVFLGGILSAPSPSSEERPELCLQVEDHSDLSLSGSGPRQRAGRWEPPLKTEASTFRTGGGGCCCCYFVKSHLPSSLKMISEPLLGGTVFRGKYNMVQLI